MKVTEQIVSTPAFRPRTITITFESQAEVEAAQVFFGSPKTATANFRSIDVEGRDRIIMLLRMMYKVLTA